MRPSALTRRSFSKRLAAAGSVLPFAEVLAAEGSRTPPTERLNIGVIGVANRGADNLAAVASENIVAVCDVDLDNLGKAKSAFPKAAAFQDFRKLLDLPKLDAVVVSTPDHMHAIPAVMAMRLGKHVYCEKPLAHSVHETRVMTEAAAKNKLVTQMGTQIHATANYRRVVEAIRSGAIGTVARVHVWNPVRPEPGIRVQNGTPPATLDYNLWIGPAPMRPYHVSHLHFRWRWWWDFGGGVLADLGCHYIDLAFWALGLTAPIAIEAKGKKDYDGDNEVPGVMQVDYHFPARAAQPPVHLTWYHGGWKPEGAEKYGMPAAVLFVGEKGELVANYSQLRLLPEDRFKGIEIPRTIPDSIGHHQEWLLAIKEGGKTTCSFDYSGPLTEAVLLGNVSYRCGQKRLEWNSEKFAVTNNLPEAESLLRPEYRTGWSL